jgi:histidine ammonia-lyase
MMLLQYTAAALASENKVLAHPASADSIPTSANQEDHVSMGAIAARHAMAVVANVQHILALELLCATQGLDFRLAQSVEAGLKVGLGSGVGEARRRVRQVVSHLDRDRIQTPDIEAALGLIKAGTLVDLVGA